MLKYKNPKEIRTMEQVPVYEIHLPEYQVDTEPDHEVIGTKVDTFIKQTFMGQHIAVRCIASSEHPRKTIDEVVGIIRKLGHDRYDPMRVGDRYETNEKKKIEIFAFDYHIDENSKIFSVFTWPNYHLTWRKPYHPIRIDIIIIYDSSKLEQIEFTYAGRESEGKRSDGFVFKDVENKAEALKAIIKIL